MSGINQVGKHGGARLNAGRKKSAPNAEQIAREFVFPALCQAFKADPGRWKANYLSVHLSKLDIKRAYGLAGLAIWCRYFKQEISVDATGLVLGIPRVGHCILGHTTSQNCLLRASATRSKTCPILAFRQLQCKRDWLRSMLQRLLESDANTQHVLLCVLRKYNATQHIRRPQ